MEQFRRDLEAADPDDETAVVAAVKRRVSELSGRHLDIQDRIEERERTREELAERLADLEDEIVAQADDTVEQDVESIDDLESLPPDATPEFDLALVREVEEVQAEARQNYEATSEEGDTLHGELSGSNEELSFYRDVLGDISAGELTATEAREKLLAYLDEVDSADATGETDDSADATDEN